LKKHFQSRLRERERERRDSEREREREEKDKERKEGRKEEKERLGNGHLLSQAPWRGHSTSVLIQCT
jgi:hypothetical protein